MAMELINPPVESLAALPLLGLFKALVAGLWMVASLALVVAALAIFIAILPLAATVAIIDRWRRPGQRSPREGWQPVPA